MRIINEILFTICVFIQKKFYVYVSLITAPVACSEYVLASTDAQAHTRNRAIILIHVVSYRLMCFDAIYYIALHVLMCQILI